MGGTESTAKRYRDRAEELRAIAQVFSYPEHKTALLSIATNFEQLAKSIEGVASFRQAEGEGYGF
jgi:hypothetical protein